MPATLPPPPPLRDRLVVSHLTLRTLIGLMGATLPVVLVFGAWDAGLQPSISAYYHVEPVRDWFVGILFAVGFFLVAYRGHDRDNAWATLAGLLAIAVALLPTDGAGASPTLTGRLHLGAAAGFFLILAYFSLCLFTRSHGMPAQEPRGRRLWGCLFGRAEEAALPPDKRRRNRVYRLCGHTMLGCLAGIAVYKLWLAGRPAIDALQPVFWLEALALVAFGLSWLTKGEAQRRLLQAVRELVAPNP